MGPDQKFFGLGFGFGKFILKIPSGQKKFSSDWVKKHPGQRQVSLLFTAGQKYPRVGSSPISRFISLITIDTTIFKRNSVFIFNIMKDFELHRTFQMGKK